MTVSITEIARQAKVSRTTASLILNRSPGHERFSDSVRSRVMATARELNWSRHGAHRSHDISHSGGIALILGHFIPNSAVYRYVIYALERAAYRQGLNIIIFTGDMASTLATIRKIGCTDLLFINWDRAPLPLHDELAGFNIVTFWDVPAGMSGVRVSADNGLTRCVSHLHALGHTSICWLYPEMGPESNFTKIAQRRWRPIRLAAERLGMSSCRKGVRYRSRHDRGDEEVVHEVQREVTQLLPDLRRYGAVICFSEIFALALYHAAHGTLEIPAELSVIGIDDILSGTMLPRLSCINFKLDTCADEVISLLFSKRSEPQVIEVDSEFVIRDSCGRRVDG